MRPEAVRLAEAIKNATAGLTEAPDIDGVPQGMTVRVHTRYPDKPHADSSWVGNWSAADAHRIAGQLAADLGGSIERDAYCSLRVFWGTPSRWLSIGQLAERAGLAESTIRTYRTRGTAPTPDAMIGGTPGWTEATADAWIATLPGRGTRTDLTQPAREATTMAPEIHTLTDGDNSTITVTRAGGEVRTVSVTDGVEVDRSLVFSGDDDEAAEWLRRYLVDAPSDGWTVA